MNNMAQRPVKDASLSPIGSLETLSQSEVLLLTASSNTDTYRLFRQCALAILNTGSDVDNAKTILEAYPDFAIELEQQDRGIRMHLTKAPADAFVDEEIITSTREMLFSALRDILYSQSAFPHDVVADNSLAITNQVFRFLRHARALRPGVEPNLVVCWGGHSIGDVEFKYTKNVGHELGLRHMNICTGCGPGAMRGPMKGATIAHAKQRTHNARYLGLTEPGIIAAEAPNPIVNELVIMPNIEQRLEAFVRLGHGIIIFPGGPGTSEELLYLLGILLHPNNKDIPFPLVLTGPETSHHYFEKLNDFVGLTLGAEAQSRYQIIINDPQRVAQVMAQGLKDVTAYRIQHNDAFHYNWMLTIDLIFQTPFDPTHDNMRTLTLSHDIPVHELAANLRRVFSGIVAGNVKEEGILAIEKLGPFDIQGDPSIMSALDDLLADFVAHDRMKLPGGATYEPCYRLVR